MSAGKRIFSSSITSQGAKTLQGTDGSPGQESKGSCLEHTVCWSHRLTSRECRESTEAQEPESQTHHRLSLLTEIFLLLVQGSGQLDIIQRPPLCLLKKMSAGAPAKNTHFH